MQGYPAVLISPDSSRRRAAFLAASANGGAVNSRGPGALISDGITGGFIIAAERG